MEGVLDDLGDLWDRHGWINFAYSIFASSIGHNVFA